MNAVDCSDSWIVSGKAFGGPLYETFSSLEKNKKSYNAWWLLLKSLVKLTKDGDGLCGDINQLLAADKTVKNNKPSEEIDMIQMWTDWRFLSCPKWESSFQLPQSSGSGKLNWTLIIRLAELQKILKYQTQRVSAVKVRVLIVKKNGLL